ncbi:hypothetical protein [Prevotella sp. HUN102]|uniref:hypothetical protein n=1 Tax=Prevotella sp. HUN102 TaxID=1392486 RepID=UPI00048CF254|nr:hypothetical protein [Prevotella sp. HUN102]
MERPKIPLYKIRSFGDKFSDTFEFIKENRRVWFKGNVYLLLPLCLLQALCMNSVFSEMLDMETGVASEAAMIKVGVSYILLFLFFMLGTILLSAFTYAMMRYHNEQPNGLRGATLKDLKPMIVKCAKRAFLIGLMLTVIIFVILFVMGLLIAASGMVVFFLIFLLVGVAAIVPLALIYPVYCFEDNETVFSSIQRGISLGLRSYWGILGFLLVLSFLTNTLQSIFMIPWYIMALIKGVFGTSNSGVAFTDSAIYNFVLYLFGVLQAFGMYLSTSLSLVGLGFQYGSIAEEVDGFSVEEDIEHFEEKSGVDADIDNFDKLV